MIMRKKDFRDFGGFEVFLFFESFVFPLGFPLSFGLLEISENLGNLSFLFATDGDTVDVILF